MRFLSTLHTVLLAAAMLFALAAAKGDTYLMGVGRGDITSPVVEIPFSGYAMLDQKGSGLRQRLYARAFIIGDAQGKDRFLYVIIDTMGGDTAIRNGVLDALKFMGPEYTAYSDDNFALVGTHSHSGPGGWHNYVLPQVPSLGFIKPSYQAIVDGTVKAIQRAHESLTQGTISVGEADVEDGNINRSLHAYLANPQEERDKYASSTDTKMTLLRLRRNSDNKDIGVLSWYSVHGTSAYNNNTIVTGDNKGVAAYLFETKYGASGNAAPGFVAGFSQANVGDSSPNVLGAWCEDGSGVQCNIVDAKCPDGKVQSCHGRGPMFTAHDNGISSAYEIGRRQYAAADKIVSSLEGGGTDVVGPSVKSFHFFHDMQYYSFPLPNGTIVNTCPAALGTAFGAGTTDGPGEEGFMQSDSGMSQANPFWKFVGGVLKTPSDKQKACHGPKPILLDVGEMTWPYAWTANIVDISVFRVGQLFIVISPVESTTMAGRRWREAIAAAAKTVVDTPPLVVLGGPANTYCHYATTPEEYAIQRYEGASTLHGQYTLYAYINLTVSALPYLSPSSTAKPPKGPLPPDSRKQSVSFLTDVVLDNSPINTKIGTCKTQPPASAKVGAVVSATFQGANPRNNLRLEGTYAAVDQYTNGQWTQVRSDYDWYLVYEWTRTNLLGGWSDVKISWETANDNVQPGTYRLHYYGDLKAIGSGKISAFEGISNNFTITA